jgi:hypothetical protein
MSEEFKAFIEKRKKAALAYVNGDAEPLAISSSSNRLQPSSGRAAARSTAPRM